MNTLTYLELRVLEYLSEDDRRFVTLEALVVALPDFTIRQMIGALKSLKRLHYVTGSGSFAATGLGQAKLHEVRTR